MTRRSVMALAGLYRSPATDGTRFGDVFLAVALMAPLPLVFQQLLWLRAVTFAHEAAPLHTIGEIVHVAAVAAMFCVSWFAPRGEYRLRPTVIACLCAPILLFDVLHLMTYPGMPDFAAIDGERASFYFSRLAQLMFPLVLMALVLTPGGTVLPARLRWSMLLATLAFLLPLVGYVAVHSAELPKATMENVASPAACAVFLFIILLNLIAAGIAIRRGDMTPSVARHAVFAALTAALSEAWMIPGGDAYNAFNILSHVVRWFTVAAAFAAIYGEAIGVPYGVMERSRVAAMLDKERLEAVFRSIADGVIVVDSNLVVTAMNPVARHLLGGRQGSQSGIPIAQLLGAVDASAARVVIGDVGACVRESRSRLRRNSVTFWTVAGNQVAIEHAVSPVYDRFGKVQGAVLVVKDVTERWRLQEDLRSAADYARNLIDASLDPMVAVDLEGHVADVNRAAEAVAGLPRSALVGSKFAAHFTDPQRAQDSLRQVMPNGAVRDLSLVMRRPDGSGTEVSCNITPYRGRDEAVRGAFVVARDVTEMRQVQKQLEFQATCDPLTGLPNRRLFRSRIESAMARSNAAKQWVAIMLIDLDDFKDVNDTRGHSIGDDLLKGVAQRLIVCMKEGNTVARIGGDEFGVLVESVGHPGEVEAMAREFLKAVTIPLLLDGCEINVSCSIGVALFPTDADSADVLLRNADTAMYRAKEAGKNNWQRFTAEMDAAVRRRVDLGNRLRNALARKELSLHYQPQVDLVSGKTTGVEALLRWHAEGLGAVSPLEFIPVAEDTGAVLPIGTWVLSEACRHAAHWYWEQDLEVAVAVNLSVRQFRDNDIVADIERALQDSGLPARLLELELTESLLVRDPERIAETLRALKALGVTIAIDDFGTGYSSLSYLKRFPLDCLKIDRSFVTDIPGDPSDEAIVRSIIAMAHSLGLKVIAEGVETAEQRAFLQKQGCDEIQGYLVSRPRPLADVLPWLQESHGLPHGAVKEGLEGAGA